MHPLSTPRFIAKRLADNWKLLLSVFVGIAIAATLVSGAPVYVKALARIGFRASLEKSHPLVLNIITTSPNVPIGREGLARVESSVEAAYQANVSPIYAGRDSYVKTDTFLLGPSPVFPRARLALVQEPSPLSGDAQQAPSLGYFMNSHSLDEHVEFVRGRAPEAVISEGASPTYAPIVDAALGSQTAEELGLDIGDEVLLSAAANTGVSALARIVGIIDAIDPADDFWRGRASLFFSPSFGGELPDLDVEVDRQRPMAAFIIAPEAASKLPDDLAAPSRYETEPAYFASATRLGQHVTMIEGRLPEERVSAGPRGPVIEAMAGVALADFFDVHVGDVVSLTPFIDEPTWVSAHIVGIAERTDLDDPYWRWGPNSFFVPPDPNEPPQLALLVTRDALVGGVAKTYPGTLASFAWYATVDSGGFEDWSAEETRRRLRNLESDLAETLPGQLTSTGIEALVMGFERRVLLGSVPVLLLVATTVVTVVYFVSMMVSYLVQSRERDVALLKTRGISTPRVFRLYGVEGLAVTIIAVAAAPLLALGAVALAGKLPYFDEVTGGDLLPVQFGYVPFLAAAGVGILCLGVLIVPSVLAARASLVGHKLRSSRPPTVPFFHRYYLDIGLLIVGGIIFWELQSRGHLVAGGLFRDVEVNETLLLAPVLLMVVVALVFMRLFPLVLKFISGESPALVHALVVASLAVLIPGVIVRELLEGNSAAWAGPVALLSAFAAAYLTRARSHSFWWRFSGLVAQVPLAITFAIVERLGTTDLLFVPTVTLILVAPAQVVFLLLGAYARTAPAWVSLALWRMARNPLQYTWMVLLLVLVSGLATVSYTVGATLDQRDEARILYDVAADVRVVVKAPTNGWALGERLALKPGVDLASPAYRTRGSAELIGGSFDVLAVRSLEFPDISWYRQDFSAKRLDGVMAALQPQAPPTSFELPSGSTQIGVWSKSGLSGSGRQTIRTVIQDASGTTRVVRLGEVERDWRVARAELPRDLAPPLRLVAVQVLPRNRLTGLPNSVILDDIHVTIGADATEAVLDDFEGAGTWSPMPTALDETKSVIVASDDAYRGASALAYRFAQERGAAAPGIFQGPGGGPVPVVASDVFAESLGIGIDTAFVAEIDGTFVPMVVRETVRNFPTMGRSGNGFLIADFDQLMQHLSVREPEIAVAPNELFIALSTGAPPQVRDQVLAELHALSGLGLEVHGREFESESFEINPLVTAGWRAVAIASAAVVVFTAVAGIVTYLLFFSDANRGEMGVVRALGLAHRQMISLLAVEHVLIAIVGMGLGTWAGLRMSSMMVPLVSLAESGGEVLPPILVTTNWGTLSVLYVVVAGTFATVLFVLNRRDSRWELETASRLER